MRFNALPERLRSKIVRRRKPKGSSVVGDCWVWTAWVSHKGYGLAWDSDRRHCNQAHVVVWRILVGDIPEDRPQLDHLCRRYRCVRPSHLEPVTHAENQRRKPRAA